MTFKYSYINKFITLMKLFSDCQKPRTRYKESFCTYIYEMNNIPTNILSELMR